METLKPELKPALLAGSMAIQADSSAGSAAQPLTPPESVALPLDGGLANVAASDAKRDSVERSFDPDRIYGFSRAATREGESGPVLTPDEALVARFLATKVQRSKKTRDGRRWFYESAKNLVRQNFPWIAPATMATLLKRLEGKGVLRRGNYNRLPCDRTTWFSMDQAWLDRSEMDIIYFRAGDADRFGVCEAVLLRNLEYWLGRPAAEGQAIQAHILRPTDLARLLPFSVASIKRAISHLQRDRAIVGRHNHGERCREYSLGASFSGRVPAGPSAFVAPKAPETTESSLPIAPPGEAARGFGDTKYSDLLKRNRMVLNGLSDDEVLDIGRSLSREAVKFLATVDDDAVFSYFGANSLDELLEAVQARWNHSYMPDNHAALVVESVLFALAKPSWGERSCHPFFRRGVYWFVLETSARRGAWMKARKERQLRELQERFASPDAEQEYHVGLAPAEKARILRNGIYARNRIGFLDDHQNYVKDHLSFTKTDLKAAQAFFQNNRPWCPGHILVLLEQCARLDKDADEPGLDPIWHARRARRLGFLINNLDTVVNQLELSSSFPAIVLPEAAPTDGSDADATRSPETSIN